MAACCCLLSVLKGSGGSEIIQGFCRAPGLWYFRGRDDIAREGLLRRGDGVVQRRDAEPERSPRVSAAPGVRRGAPHRVLMVYSRRTKKRTTRTLYWWASGGCRGFLWFTLSGDLLICGEKITSEHRVDVMGKVLKKHRPVYRRNPLEKAFVYGVGGPSAAERRRERGILRETQTR